MPYGPAYFADPRFEGLGGEFADPVQPARFPRHILRFRNDRWAAHIGLGGFDESEWESAFARFAPLKSNQKQPLAMRYHGHQFRVYNPNIGDGRGFLFAQLRDDTGRLLDLATKGSGQTPYSRFGDGRLTLKGGVREILAAEMLEALGVSTSKAFSLYETGEPLQRNDEPSPTRSAVLSRLSHSHVRFGTFQRLAFYDRADLIRVLIDHVIECYYPTLGDLGGEIRAPALLGEIVEATARLAASWMAAGFVHGVLNTDNMNVTGESFDYGPWRFLPKSEPGFTAAYFDENGLYAFGRQPEAASWNLAQLAGCFALVAETAPLEQALQRFAPAYRLALRDRVFARLALKGGDLDANLKFLQSLFAWMTESRVPWAQFFHDWRGGEARAALAKSGPAREHYARDDFAGIERDLRAHEGLLNTIEEGHSPPTLLIEDVEAIWDAIDKNDDWAPFNAKVAAIRAMGAV